VILEMPDSEDERARLRWRAADLVCLSAPPPSNICHDGTQCETCPGAAAVTPATPEEMTRGERRRMSSHEVALIILRNR
jgi:hypothetical protein